MKTRIVVSVLATSVAIAVAVYLSRAASPDTESLQPKQGDHVTARLKSGKQKWDLTPNSLGIFPTVITRTNTPIEIQLWHPQASAGDLAVVTVRDGGKLTGASGGSSGKGKGGTGSVLRTRIGNDHKIEFSFAYGAEFHNQRVTAQVGKSRFTFEFHVDH